MNDSDIYTPLLVSEKRLPSEVRRYVQKLAEGLTERIAPEIAADEKVLFVFILRGAMLLYPPFAEKFESASFTFVTAGTFTMQDNASVSDNRNNGDWGAGVCIAKDGSFTMTGGRISGNSTDGTDDAPGDGSARTARACAAYTPRGSRA